MGPSNIMLLNRYHVLKKFATIDFSIFCMSNIEPFKMTYSGLSQMEILSYASHIYEIFLSSMLNVEIFIFCVM